MDRLAVMMSAVVIWTIVPMLVWLILACCLKKNNDRTVPESVEAQGENVDF